MDAVRCRQELDLLLARLPALLTPVFETTPMMTGWIYQRRGIAQKEWRAVDGRPQGRQGKDAVEDSFGTAKPPRAPRYPRGEEARWSIHECTRMHTNRHAIGRAETEARGEGAAPRAAERRGEAWGTEGVVDLSWPIKLLAFSASHCLLQRHPLSHHASAPPLGAPRRGAARPLSSGAFLLDHLRSIHDSCPFVDRQRSPTTPRALRPCEIPTLAGSPVGEASPQERGPLPQDAPLYTSSRKFRRGPWRRP